VGKKARNNSELKKVSKIYKEQQSETLNSALENVNVRVDKHRIYNLYAQFELASTMKLYK
jgi:ribosomal protein L12E/L44/L45/RPP1/RPP2